MNKLNCLLQNYIAELFELRVEYGDISLVYYKPIQLPLRTWLYIFKRISRRDYTTLDTSYLIEKIQICKRYIDWMAVTFTLILVYCRLIYSLPRGARRLVMCSNPHKQQVRTRTEAAHIYSGVIWLLIRIIMGEEASNGSRITSYLPSPLVSVMFFSHKLASIYRYKLTD